MKFILLLSLFATTLIHAENTPVKGGTKFHAGTYLIELVPDEDSNFFVHHGSVKMQGSTSFWAASQTSAKDVAGKLIPLVQEQDVDSNLGFRLRVLRNEGIKTPLKIGVQRRFSEYGLGSNPVDYHWICEIDSKDIPIKIGERTVQKCTFKNSVNLGVRAWDAWGPALESRSGTVSITKEKSEEVITRAFCDDPSNRIVILLRRGVKGYDGEDDFQFSVALDPEKNGPKFSVSNHEGVIKENIAYCPKGDTVSIKISAIERDLVFNDHYEAKGKSIVEIPIKNGSITEYKLHRVGSRRHDSTIEIEVIDPREKPIELQAQKMSEPDIPLPAHRE